MAAINHDVKIATHIIVAHFNWIEDATIKAVIKQAKESIQQALKPGHVPGGSADENIGKIPRVKTVLKIVLLCRSGLWISRC